MKFYDFNEVKESTLREIKVLFIVHLDVQHYLADVNVDGFCLSCSQKMKKHFIEIITPLDSEFVRYCSSNFLYKLHDENLMFLQDEFVDHFGKFLSCLTICQYSQELFFLHGWPIHDVPFSHDRFYWPQLLVIISSFHDFFILMNYDAEVVNLFWS